LKTVAKRAGLEPEVFSGQAIWRSRLAFWTAQVRILTPVRDGHPFHEASLNWRTGLDFSGDRGEELLEEFF
jgi:hypothetical protein